MTAIEKANKAKQALRIISRYFLPQKMVKPHCFTVDFTMEQRFGFLLPCPTLKKKLWQTSLKMLKICQKDWQDSQNASQNIQESNSRNVIKLQRSMWNVQC